MTESEALARAHALHRKIKPVLDEADLKRVAEFIRATFIAGRESVHQTEWKMVEVTEPGGKGRAWVYG